jgi:hypothetical protein
MLCDLIPKLAGQFQKEKWTYHHRCSNAGTERCIRASIYDALGVPAQPFAGRTILVFDDGNWHEELTKDWLRKSSYKIHSEQMDVTPFEVNGKPVRGHIDWIVTDTAGVDTLVEHKAINHFSWARYSQGDLWPLDYITQVVCYIVGLQKVTGNWLPGLLLIKNKNTAHYLEYRIEYDNQTDIVKCNLFIAEEKPEAREIKEFFLDDIMAKAINRFEEIDRCVEEKKLPLRQYDMEDWHCDYCQWGELCWKDIEKEITDGTEATMPELIEQGKKYLDLGAQVKILEKEQDTIKTAIKAVLEEKKVTRAYAGDIIITRAMGEKKTLDKTLIDPMLLAGAMKVTKFVKLLIKNIKAKKESEE